MGFAVVGRDATGFPMDRSMTNDLLVLNKKKVNTQTNKQILKQTGKQQANKTGKHSKQAGKRTFNNTTISGQLLYVPR